MAKMIAIRRSRTADGGRGPGRGAGWVRKNMVMNQRKLGAARHAVCATMCYMAARARNVGVRELRQNLSVYLARVKRGQALTVTEHGRAVAELRPLPTSTDALGRLVEEGRVVPARRPPSALPRPLRLPPGRPVSALLDELREDSI